MCSTFSLAIPRKNLVDKNLQEARDIIFEYLMQMHELQTFIRPLNEIKVRRIDQIIKAEFDELYSLHTGAGAEIRPIRADKMLDFEDPCRQESLAAKRQIEYGFVLALPSEMFFYFQTGNPDVISDATLELWEEDPIEDIG